MWAALLQHSNSEISKLWFQTHMEEMFNMLLCWSPFLQPFKVLQKLKKKLEKLEKLVSVGLQPAGGKAAPWAGGSKGTQSAHVLFSQFLCLDVNAEALKQ